METDPEAPVPRPEPLTRPSVKARHRGVRPVFLLMLVISCAVVVLVVTRLRREAGDPGPQDWFFKNRAHCNSVEVTTFLSSNDPGPGTDGASYRAGCLALGGKIAAAREVILALPAANRDQAVSFVFNVGHPVADQGDDESAGPIMELVVEFQPDQYMALYHAGMAEAGRGDDARARANLTRFLQIYRNEDGWGANAKRALAALDRPQTERTVQQGAEGSVVY